MVLEVTKRPNIKSNYYPTDPYLLNKRLEIIEKSHLQGHIQYQDIE